jgi:hypothetical protein
VFYGESSLGARVGGVLAVSAGLEVGNEVFIDGFEFVESAKSFVLSR